MKSTKEPKRCPVCERPIATGSLKRYHPRCRERKKKAAWRARVKARSAA